MQEAAINWERGLEAKKAFPALDACGVHSRSELLDLVYGSGAAQLLYFAMVLLQRRVPE